MTRFFSALVILAAVLCLLANLANPVHVLASRDAQASTAAPPDLPYYESAALTPQWSVPATSPIEPFTLHDQYDMPFTRQDLDGHVSVVGFFYGACEGLCPQTISNERVLEKAFRDDDKVQLVSMSVTDEAAPVLADYAKAHGIVSEKWRLVTGDPILVGRLEKTSFFAAPHDADATHTENLVLVDGQRHIRGVYKGTLPLDIERLKNDIHTLEATR